MILFLNFRLFDVYKHRRRAPTLSVYICIAVSCSIISYYLLLTCIILHIRVSSCNILNYLQPSAIKLDKEGVGGASRLASREIWSVYHPHPRQPPLPPLPSSIFIHQRTMSIGGIHDTCWNNPYAPHHHFKPAPTSVSGDLCRTVLLSPILTLMFVQCARQ